METYPSEMVDAGTDAYTRSRKDRKTRTAQLKGTLHPQVSASGISNSQADISAQESTILTPISPNVRKAARVMESGVGSQWGPKARE